MRLSVQLVPIAAAAMHGHETEHAGVQALLQGLDALGVRLRPLHPGTDDPQLARDFAVDVPDDEERLNRIRSFLQNSSVVNAAYVKPRAAPP